MTEPCPECGVPACGRADILWYEYNNQRIAIIFDGGYFDLAKEEFIKNILKTNSYHSLPNFSKNGMN